MGKVQLLPDAERTAHLMQDFTVPSPFRHIDIGALCSKAANSIWETWKGNRIGREKEAGGYSKRAQ